MNIELKEIKKGGNMIEIRNKENKRLIINLPSGTIDLLAKSTATISDEDFSSLHLQNLLRSGKIIVSRTETKPEGKAVPKKGGLPRKEESEPEEEKLPETVSTEESEISSGTSLETEPEVSPETSGETESEEKKPKRSSYIKKNR